MNPEAALSACRLLHDASAMLLWGASAYLATLVPQSLGREIGRRLTALAIAAGIASVATTAVALPLEAAIIGEGWADAIDPATIRAVLFETSVGFAWQMQAGAAVVLALMPAVPSRHRRAATALASALVLIGVTLTGHAVMQSGWAGFAHRINDAVHLLAAGAWLGALVPLLRILGILDVPEFRADAGIALRRFSAAGHVTVALTVATGMINTLLILGHWPTDWSSPYQIMLACKIVLVAMMVGLALVNRYAFVPRIGRHGVHALAAVRRGTVAEIVLGLGVVGLVAVFGLLEPI